jgi:hypothetical protein
MNFTKNFFATKSWFCVCSVIAKMFKHQNSDKNWKKIIKKFYNFDRGQIMFLVRPKRHFKISHACVPLKTHRNTYKNYMITSLTQVRNGELRASRWRHLSSKKLLCHVWTIHTRLQTFFWFLQVSRNTNWSITIN